MMTARPSNSSIIVGFLSNKVPLILIAFTLFIVPVLALIEGFVFVDSLYYVLVVFFASIVAFTPTATLTSLLILSIIACRIFIIIWAITKVLYYARLSITYQEAGLNGSA